MHRSLPLALLLLACRGTAPRSVAPDVVVEGRMEGVALDTVTDGSTVAIDRGRWSARASRAPATDFWLEVSSLDLARAERAAATVEQRTFARALEGLMASDAEAAAVAFSALQLSARDPIVRARARVGLTIALSWRSDWPALAQLPADPDSTTDSADPLPRLAAVDRWARALGSTPSPLLELPAAPVVLPLRRSAFGTPVVAVRINGRPYEFWLDTGASMTLISADVAQASGVPLAAGDSLALGVVTGHIPARAVLIDSLSMGPVTARGLGAAVVNASVLRLDRREEQGQQRSVPIAGVIGTDILRHVDMVIDAANATITLSRPVRTGRTTRNLFWVGYPVVRLVGRDGRTALFGLDTGAEATYVTTTLLRKDPSTRIAARRRTIGGLGEQVQRTEYVAQRVSLSDGDHALELRNVPIAPERRWTFVTFDGVIGSDVALASRLHLDFTNGVFELLPRK